MAEEERKAKYLSQLACIDLSEEEESILNWNLEKILNYMNLLNEIDTQEVLPCAHVLETVQNVMEEDVEGPLLPREKILQNAPDHIGGMIKIPPVMQIEI